MSDEVLGYVRVSTDEQARSGLGLDAQREAIQAEADRRGWTVQWVEDHASGKTMRRDGLQQALAQLDGDGPDVLVAFSLDRLSRSALDFLQLAKRADDAGWSLVILQFNGDRLDTTTPMGRFTATLFAALAELERQQISERTKTALAQAKRNGTRLGRPVTIPQPVRERIAAERAEGRSLKAIADGLTADRVPRASGGAGWWPSTVQSVLRSLDRDAEATEARQH